MIIRNTSALELTVILSDPSKLGVDLIKGLAWMEGRV